jgi:hypothetical protein
VGQRFGQLGSQLRRKQDLAFGNLAHRLPNRG